MLLHHQVGNLRSFIAAGERDFRDRVAEFNVEVLPVEIEDSEDKSPTVIEQANFYQPARIFDTPEDPQCLAGIGDWPLTLPARTVTRVPNGRVIGTTAVIDPSGRLFMPNRVSRQNLDHFLHENLGGHHRCVLTASEEAVLCGFIARPEPQRIDLDAAFVHNLEPANYGSFIVRQLPQLLNLREQVGSFDCYITPICNPWFRDALRLVGLPEKPVFTVEEVCGEIFRSVTFSNLLAAEGFFRPEVRAEFRSLAERATAYSSGALAANRIFVSRSLSTIARLQYRPLVNEAELITIARARGFGVLHPETLSFAQQLATFSTADRIVGPSGSGMLNAAFAPPGSRVLDVESFTQNVRQHAKVYASSGHRYSFLFGSTIGDEGRPLYLRPWRVNLTAFAEAMDWLDSAPT